MNVLQKGAESIYGRIEYLSFENNYALRIFLVRPPLNAQILRHFLNKEPPDVVCYHEEVVAQAIVGPPPRWIELVKGRRGGGESSIRLKLPTAK